MVSQVLTINKYIACYQQRLYYVHLEFFLLIGRYCNDLLIILDQFCESLVRIHCNHSHGLSSKNVKLCKINIINATAFN